MKHITLLLLAAGGFAVAAAQTRTDYDYKNKKLSLPALAHELQKGERYMLQLPGRFQYFSSTQQIRAEIGTPFVDMGAADDYKPTFTFELVSGGMKDVKAADPRWYRSEVYDASGVPRPLKGFVRDYSCSFPCVLIIRNQNKTALDTITITADERFTVTLHRDLLAPDNSVSAPKRIIPFESQQQIVDLEERFHEAILKKVEQFAAAQLFQKAGAAVTMLFRGNYSHETFGWGYIKAKRGTASAIPELDTAVANFKLAVDSLVAGNPEKCRSICAANRVALEALLSDPRADKNVQEVLLYNLSHASLLSGDIAASENYYSRMIAAGTQAESTVAHDLRRLIDLMSLYHYLKQQLPSAPPSI